jgi:transmembrane sensor
MTQSCIKREAAKWLIELDTAQNIEEHWPAFEAWLDENPEHRAAFTSMEKAWKAVEDLQVFHVKHKTLLKESLFSPQRKLSVFHRSWNSPRQLAGAAVMVLAFACTAVVLHQMKRAPAPVQAASWERYATDYGERKPVRLADGSTMELNTNTQLRVNRASSGREVVLDQGEALFAVTHDPEHPFLVRVGTTSVQALGTTFSVRRTGNAETMALVKEGKVQVTETAYPPKMVLAQHTATAGPSGVQVTAVEPAKIDRMLSWRKGQLAFKGETLAEVVAEFNRYNRTKLKIDDQRIAQKRIGGTFSANDPAGFAVLLEHTFGIRHVLETPDSSQTQVIHLSSANP